MEMHTDTDLGMPDGAVAAIDAAAWRDDQDDWLGGFNTLFCLGYSLADIFAMTPKEFYARVYKARETLQ